MFSVAFTVLILLWFVLTFLNWFGLDYKWFKLKLKERGRKG